MILFLTTALTALAAHNVVFARALGLGRPTMFLKSARVGILYGVIFTGVATLSSAMAAAISFLWEGNSLTAFLRAPLYFLCVATVYLAVFFGIPYVWRSRRKEIRRAMPIAIFNSALFGVLYVSAGQQYSAVETIGYALGAGAGYTAALVIIYYARKRLAISPVPRSFRGLPILLVYLGLLSLAIYGLIGHMLPV
jgi:electron transport complex protein RnfA